MTIKKEQAKDFFDKTRFRMEELKLSLVPMIESRIKDAEIDYHGVSGRTKSEESFIDKVERKGYDDLSEQLTDFCGIRIITYFPSQAIEIAAVLRKTFTVDEKNSSDKADDLGDSRVGYQSLHLVCTLGRERKKFPEYSKLSELKFEVQIRTILQHAWAELAHDGSYKFSGELPPKLQRKLNLQAGVLELVDEQLEEISANISKYESEISKSNRKLRSEGLNTISFDRVYKNTLKGNTSHIYTYDESLLSDAIKELRTFGVQSVVQFDNLIDDTLQDYWIKATESTPIGFARDAMLYSDFEKYFDDVYPRFTRWKWIDQASVDMLSTKYGADEVSEILKKNRIKIEN